MEPNIQKKRTQNNSNLESAILNRKLTVGVIGLGYVGLPLIRAIHTKGYQCIGFDTDIKKIKLLHAGKSYLKTLKDEEVLELKESSRFLATFQTDDIAQMDIILICVPTPLTKNREPDMRFIIKAAETIKKYLKFGHLIILESTTYPGTTRDLVKPILEGIQLKVGQDFYLAYSPEREDPGNSKFDTASIPKVIGADDKISEQLALTFYKEIVPQVTRVSSSAIAEAVKITENIFRFVNIALVNELKCIYDKMDIDVWEVIDAAKTKPFGYMPFYPGPGLGGHCIPIDPFYLTWKAREYGLATQLIELSGQINNQMASYTIKKLRQALDLRVEKGLKNTRILILGIAYKKNIDDLRESPALIIFDKLISNQAWVDYYDPYIQEIGHNGEYKSLLDKKSITLDIEQLKTYDAVVICTDHDCINYDIVVENSKLIIDTRNATQYVQGKKSNVIKA